MSTALFAPTDDAFPPALVNYLAQPENVDTLSAVLQYHVVADKVLSGALMNGQIVDSLTGSTLTISIMGDTIMVNDATVITPNVEGTNGVIHIIDKVLVPPDGSISLPNLVDTAVANSDLSTLVDAVVAADLATALSSPGPFTVFAPTDDGFGMIPAADLAGLITAEDKTPLRNILLYHVVQELITGQDILDGLLSATTMQGAELTFSVMDGVPMVNGTPVLGTAVATNGIAHVIGEVLTAPSIVELAAGSPDFSTLVAAVTAAGLAPVLSAPGPFSKLFCYRSRVCVSSLESCSHHLVFTQMHDCSRLCPNQSGLSCCPCLLPYSAGERANSCFYFAIPCCQRQRLVECPHGRADVSLTFARQ
jgi:transforming growth factor-beta-induced protein